MFQLFLGLGFSAWGSQLKFYSQSMQEAPRNNISHHFGLHIRLWLLLALVFSKLYRAVVSFGPLRTIMTVQGL